MLEVINHTHCCYCRRKFDDTNYNLKKTKEHFIPTSKGGLNKENIIQCCSECNAWKADKLPEFWLNQVERHCNKQNKKGTYTITDYRQIIGSIRHWIKFFKGKVISTYKH